MEVVVIGGGISGLYTILRLAHHPRFKKSNFTLYEASEDLGGRIKTTYSKEGIPLNLGAGRFSTKSHLTLYKLMGSLGIRCMDFNYTKLANYYRGLPIITDPTKKTNLCSDAKKLYGRETYFESNIFIMNLLEECQKNQLLKSPNLDLHAISFKNWILNYSSIQAFDLLNQLSGYDVISNKLLPADEGLKILKQHPEVSSGFLNDTLESTWKQPTEGFGQVIKAIVNKIRDMPNLQLFTKHKVTKIKKQGNKYRLYIDGVDNKNICLKADLIFLTLAANSISKVELSPSISNIRQIFSGVVQVPLFKLFLHFPKNWWEQYVVTKKDFLIINEGPERKFYFSNHKNEVMIYNDSDDAVWMYQQFCINQEKIVSYLNNKLASLFGLSKIPQIPNNIKYYFWEAGVSFWRINTQKEKLDSIKEKHAANNLYIISDMITESPGWINSTLESIDELIDTM